MQIRQRSIFHVGINVESLKTSGAWSVLQTPSFNFRQNDYYWIKFKYDSMGYITLGLR